MYGHATIVKYLADHGADLDIADAEHNTPLLIAAARGNWISVQDLIELGADFMMKVKMKVGGLLVDDNLNIA